MRRLLGLTLVLAIAACGDSPTFPEAESDAPMDVGPAFGHTAGANAPSIVETFDDAILDELEDADDAFTVSDGRIQKTAFTPFQGRSYVRTLATGYDGADFTAELTFTTQGSFAAIHFIGIGDGSPDPAFFTEPSGIYFRIHEILGGNRVDVVAREAGERMFSHFETFGTIVTDGPHTARIVKTGNTLEFSIDVGNDGTFDLVAAPVDISTAAPFLDDSNSRIFFGTDTPADWFDDLIIEAGSNDPDTRADCKKGGWADFGFRNQGQCIRFVNTGKDSR